MPQRDDHLAQAQHNQHFYNSFDTAAYSDWAATVLFYAGLHYIDAFLATRTSPIHPPKHKVRDRWVSTLSELKPLVNDYFKLKSSSETARYFGPVAFPLAHLGQLELCLDRIVRGLRPYFPIR